MFQTIIIVTLLRGESPPADPNVVAFAYDSNLSGTLQRTPYLIDSAADSLVLLLTPYSDGILRTVGPLGVNASEITGLSIYTTGTVASPVNTAFAAITSPGDSVSKLYTIDLSTGAATLVGTIGKYEQGHLYNSHRRHIGLKITPASESQNRGLTPVF